MDDHFGYQCPSGALIRSWNDCAHGRLCRAQQSYPLGPALLGYFPLQIPYRIWVLLRAPRHLPPWPRRLHALATAIVVAMILFDWLFRFGKRVI